MDKAALAKREIEYLSNIAKDYDYKVDRSDTGVPMYSPEDIAFVNTAEFTRTAQHFMKHGVYTKAHPVYDRSDWNDFWDREEYRRKNGMTLPGKMMPDGSLQEVHITGEYYGYLNYGQIKLTPKDNRFSTEDGEFISRYARATAKKKITFPDFWDGDYHYFKAKSLARTLGLNLFVGKARRKGYSYKNGWISANRADLYPRSVTILGAYDSASLFPEGTMQMANEYLQFISKNTDWKKRRSRTSQDHIKFAYQLNDGSGNEYGFKSQILAVSFGPNQPGAARGKDSDLILIEEAGKCRNLLDVYKSTQPTLEDGMYSTGIMIVFGTGGGDSVLWEPFEKMFFNPDLYKGISFKNEWEEGQETTHCSFFVPQYKNMPGFIDTHGNSKIEKAKEADKVERDYIKDTAEDPQDYETHVMEYCWTPSEAFSRSTSNIFTASVISEHLNSVLRNKNLLDLQRHGIIETDDKNIPRLITNDQLYQEKREFLIHPPIREFPLKKSVDPHGCVTEFVPPFKVGGKVAPIYRIWYDPFNSDKAKEDFNIKNSLACAWVYEIVNPYTPSKGDRLVAVFTGRPETVDEAHRIVFNLALYYGGYDEMIQFENDGGDVAGYAKRHDYTRLLAPEPEVAWNKELQMKGTRNFGTSINHPKRKQYGALYLRDWLFMKVGTNEHGKPILNLHYVYDIAFLRELLKWNLIGNFDRVSAAIIGMYDTREQEIIEFTNRVPDIDTGIFNDNYF